MDVVQSVGKKGVLGEGVGYKDSGETQTRAEPSQVVCPPARSSHDPPPTEESSPDVMFYSVEAVLCAMLYVINAFVHNWN